MAAGGNTPPPNIQAWLSGPAGNIRRAALVRAGLLGKSPLDQVTALTGVDPRVVASEVAHPIKTAKAIHNARGVSTGTVPMAGPVGELLAERMATAAARNQLRLPIELPGPKAAEGLLRHVVDVRQYGHSPGVNYNDANAFATAEHQHLVDSASGHHAQSNIYNNADRLPMIRRAAAFADRHMEQASTQSQHARVHELTAPQLPPWERTLGEFMLSPHTVWHGTASAPGLGELASALHAGTFNAAAERSFVPVGTNRNVNAMRFVPGWLVAKLDKILPELAMDPGSSFYHGGATGGTPFRAENAQTMAANRRLVRRDPTYLIPHPDQFRTGYTNYGPYRAYDLIPYTNDFEDAGRTSFQATRRGVFKTHADFIKEALASGLDVSKALSSYRDPAAMRKSLLVQLARERSKGLRRG